LAPREQVASDFEEKVVSINRCATVTKGGRNFCFSAVVVVGDRNGQVGFGFAKAPEVPNAVEKAVKDARRSLIRVPLLGSTIPHETWGRFGSSKVFVKPAAPGTGLIAGSALRAVLEAAGVKDILAKCYGRTNPVNVVKAAMDALKSLRTRDDIARVRGVTIE